MGASFVQEVAEVEQGVPGCQELQESLQRKTNSYIFTPSTHFLNLGVPEPNLATVG